MKTAIVYATRYGAVRECAQRVAAELSHGATLIELDRTARPKLLEYSTVIVGGSFYAGAIQPAVRNFCAASRADLLARTVVLFACGLATGEEARRQLEAAFPDWLRSHALSCSILGAKIRPAKLGLLDRFFYKRAYGGRWNMDALDSAAISQIATQVNALM